MCHRRHPCIDCNPGYVPKSYWNAAGFKLDCLQVRIEDADSTIATRWVFTFRHTVPSLIVLDDTRALIATPAMCETVAKMLANSDEDVRNSALQTLTAFSGHGEF
jgi:hypothetical protein